MLKVFMDDGSHVGVYLIEIQRGSDGLQLDATVILTIRIVIRITGVFQVFLHLQLGSQLAPGPLATSTT